MDTLSKLWRHQEGRFLALFVLTLLIHIALPIFRDHKWLNLLVGLGFVAEIGFAGLITLERRRARVIYFALVLVSLASTVLRVIYVEADQELASVTGWLLFHTCLISLTAVLVIRWTVRCKRVTLDTVFAALAGYYYMGLAWALLYATIDNQLVGGFNVDLVEGARLEQALYFSFVTLTTLGFGDITPTHPLTRALVTSEALIAQIYLAVLVSRLVSMHRAPRDDSARP